MLSQFYEKVKNKSLTILDLLDDSYHFIDSCPLCGGENCAEFLGYYNRQVVDEDGRYYPDFPVPRFECHGKGDRRIAPHKTFSLLHYHLVPYCMYSIPFIIKVLKEIHINGLTLRLLQDYIADFTGTSTGDDYIELSLNGIYAFKMLILGAITKLLTTNYYQELTDWLKRCPGNKNELIKTFLKLSQGFECCKVSVPIQGPCALSYDFYLQGGSYFHNSHFLFGTPSQHRDTKKDGSPKNKKDRPRCIVRI